MENIQIPEKLYVKIDNTWFDIKSVAQKHPGGPEILYHCHLEDLTDQFYSVHSDRAEKWLKALPKLSQDAVKKELEKYNKKDPQRSQVSLSFEQFRKQLEKDGWFERSIFGDIFYLGLTTALYVVGAIISNVSTEAGGWRNYAWIIGSLFIALGMQQAGWVSHDYGHMRGTFCRVANHITGLVYNGFSCTWWSRKHNGLHHVFTNQKNIDPDINNEPVLFLSMPDNETKDVWNRRYQYLYYHIVFAFLYVSWRMQSFFFVIEHKLYLEGALMALGYSLMFYFLKIKVIIASILIGGWFVAEVVTATHQDEEFLENKSFDFITDQFRTTRDVVIDGAFGNWFWGGMQFQLVHHLFPKMPKYYYAACSKLLIEWCKENNVEYRRSSIWEMQIRNYNVYKRNSVAFNEYKSNIVMLKGIEEQLDSYKSSMENFILNQKEEIKRALEAKFSNGSENAKKFVDQKMDKVLKQIESSFSEFTA